MESGKIYFYGGYACRHIYEYLMQNKDVIPQGYEIVFFIDQHFLENTIEIFGKEAWGQYPNEFPFHSAARFPYTVNPEDWLKINDIKSWLDAWKKEALENNKRGNAIHTHIYRSAKDINVQVNQSEVTFEGIDINNEPFKRSLRFSSQNHYLLDCRRKTRIPTRTPELINFRITPEVFFQEDCINDDFKGIPFLLAGYGPTAVWIFSILLDHGDSPVFTDIKYENLPKNERNKTVVKLLLDDEKTGKFVIPPKRLIFKVKDLANTSDQPELQKRMFDALEKTGLNKNPKCEELAIIFYLEDRNDPRPIKEIKADEWLVQFRKVVLCAGYDEDYIEDLAKNYPIYYRHFNVPVLRGDILPNDLLGSVQQQLSAGIQHLEQIFYSIEGKRKDYWWKVYPLLRGTFTKEVYEEIIKESFASGVNSMSNKFIPALESFVVPLIKDLNPQRITEALLNAFDNTEGIEKGERDLFIKIMGLSSEKILYQPFQAQVINSLFVLFLIIYLGWRQKFSNK